MNANFDIPQTRVKSLLCALVLCVCVFGALPLSVSTFERSKSKPEKLIKVYSAPSQKSAKKTSDNKRGGVELLKPFNVSAPYTGDSLCVNLELWPVADAQFACHSSGGSNFELTDFGVGSGSNSVGIFCFELSQLDRIPKLLKRPKTKFPKSMAGKSGIVELSLVIFEDGSVSVEGVEKSSDAGFEAYAEEVASKMVYETPTKGGKPVRARFTLPMSFKTVQ